MSTIHTEASVAASEVEPSASGVYDYSESINDEHDEKLDEGLRAPIPIHDDDLDTSLLSDNELEAFVKTKNHSGRAGSVPANLQYIYQRLTGHSQWSPKLYKQSQPPPAVKKIVSGHDVAIDLKSIHSGHIHREQSTEQSFSELDANQMAQSQPESSPFASMVGPLEPIDSDDRGDDDSLLQIKAARKRTFSGNPGTPHSPSITSPMFTAAPSFKMLPLGAKDEHKEKSKEDATEKNAKSRQPVAECTMKEVMQHIAHLTSEVINLQQSVYLKDIMIKNLYLRMKEMEHLSFPQLLIERVHIVANFNAKHRSPHKASRRGQISAYDHRHKHRTRVTLSEEDSVEGNGYSGYGHSGYTANFRKHSGFAANHQNSSNLIKHTSTVTLEVVTRWLPRRNLPSARKKGLVHFSEEDVAENDDYLTRQMWSEWLESGKKYSMNGLDKLKREEAHKQLAGYMQHERVGLVRIEILRGKKYRKYKRLEKKFESLIIPIAEVPKGDTYHVMIKVHNPSASLWGPLSNMVTVKVPLRFAAVDDTDSATDNEAADKKEHQRRTAKSRAAGKSTRR